MAYVEFQNNPVGRRVGDCAVRAVSKALNMGWEAAYIALVINGLQMGDMPSSNSVIGSVLRQHGFRRKNLPDECPDCFMSISRNVNESSLILPKRIRKAYFCLEPVNM